MSRFNIIKNICKLIYDRFNVISMKTRASLVHFPETGQSNWREDSCRNANDGKTSVPVGTGVCSPAAALNKQTNRWCRDADGQKTSVPMGTGSSLKQSNQQIEMMQRCRWPKDICPRDYWNLLSSSSSLKTQTEKGDLVQRTNKSSNRIKSSENAWSTKMFREGTLGWAPRAHPSALCTLGKAHHPLKITVSSSMKHLGQVIKIQVWNQN